MNRPLSTTAALAGLLPAGIGVLSAPPSALAAVLGLGGAVGVIAALGATLVLGAPARAVGWVAAGVTTEAGLALTGVLVVLGPASVAALPVLFLLVGLACWAEGPPSASGPQGGPTNVAGRMPGTAPEPLPGGPHDPSP
jgi:hypothetical protein